MKLRYKIGLGLLMIPVVALALLALAVGYDADCPPASALAENTPQIAAIVYRCYGSPEVLKLEQIAKPAPLDDEVLVKVRAASVNPLDWHYMRGTPYLMRIESGIGAPEDPRMGVDFAGTVEAVGSAVTRFAPGDNVFGGRSGAFGEYVTVRESRGIAHMPDNVSFRQAAAVPIAGVTALQALRDKGQLKAGQRVLINGASGGVGTFAVQIAKAWGAQVHGVCSTRNVQMVRGLGADHVFDYKIEDFTKSGEQYDVVIDNVGNHPLSAYKNVLTPEGILVMVGGPKGDWVAPLISPIKALMMAPFTDQTFAMILATLSPQDLALLGDLMRQGKLTSQIDREFSLADVPEAIRYSETGRARGKIIVQVRE